MIHIFFKTIWNNRKRNILVFIELFVISLILVNLTIFLVDLVTIARIKNCYNPKDVVQIGLSRSGNEDQRIYEQAFSNLKEVLLTNKIVESVSMNDYLSVPYNNGYGSTGLEYGNYTLNLSWHRVDIDYAKVMKIAPLKGRWFNETDFGKKVKPIIISKDVEEKYFFGNAIGKRIGGDYYEIIGIVDAFKNNDFESPYSSAFVLNEYLGTQLLIRTEENRTSDLLSIAESQVYSVLNPAVWRISSINTLENMRAAQNHTSAQRYYLSLIIALFIIINVFLGVIGVLWYNTNLRLHEIGIKRALGATRWSVNMHLLLENMFIAILALVIVILIFIQLYSVDKAAQQGVAIKSMIISTLLMIILVAISTWLAASFNSQIRPAVALKTE
ncbi:MAG TPA: ABC transporter permease [Bacteroidales bacterium]|nr:ABC transporter permease [Bacteroidales bacterium]